MYNCLYSIDLIKYIYRIWRYTRCIINNYTRWVISYNYKSIKTRPVSKARVTVLLNTTCHKIDLLSWDSIMRVDGRFTNRWFDARFCRKSVSIAIAAGDINIIFYRCRVFRRYANHQVTTPYVGETNVDHIITMQNDSCAEKKPPQHIDLALETSYACSRPHTAAYSRLGIYLRYFSRSACNHKREE